MSINEYQAAAIANRRLREQGAIYRQDNIARELGRVREQLTELRDLLTQIKEVLEADNG